jgi:hypothetical protein
VALSAGHPATARRTQEQREKSWYMLVFPFPGVAERWLFHDDWANFRERARHPDTAEVIGEREATGSPTSALDWYPANSPPESWLRGQGPATGCNSTHRMR